MEKQIIKSIPFGVRLRRDSEEKTIRIEAAIAGLVVWSVSVYFTAHVLAAHLMGRA